MPTAVASLAAARAVRRASSGSKLADSPSGTGNTVVNPWITSAANSSGIFSWPCRALCCRRSCQRMLELLKMSCASTAAVAVTGLAAAAAPFWLAEENSDSCPAFSSSDIRAIRSSMKTGVDLRAGSSANPPGIRASRPLAPAASSSCRRLMPCPVIPGCLHRWPVDDTGTRLACRSGPPGIRRRLAAGTGITPPKALPPSASRAAAGGHGWHARPGRVPVR